MKYKITGNIFNYFLDRKSSIELIVSRTGHQTLLIVFHFLIASIFGVDSYAEIAMLFLVISFLEISSFGISSYLNNEYGRILANKIYGDFDLVNKAIAASILTGLSIPFILALNIIFFDISINWLNILILVIFIFFQNIRTIVEVFVRYQKESFLKTILYIDIGIAFMLLIMMPLYRNIQDVINLYLILNLTCQCLIILIFLRKQSDFPRFINTHPPILFSRIKSHINRDSIPFLFNSIIVLTSNFGTRSVLLYMRSLANITLDSTSFGIFSLVFVAANSVIRLNGNIFWYLHQTLISLVQNYKKFISSVKILFMFLLIEFIFVLLFALLYLNWYGDVLMKEYFLLGASFIVYKNMEALVRPVVIYFYKNTYLILLSYIPFLLVVGINLIGIHFSVNLNYLVLIYSLFCTLVLSQCYGYRFSHLTFIIIGIFWFVSIEFLAKAIF